MGPLTIKVLKRRLPEMVTNILTIEIVSEDTMTLFRANKRLQILFQELK